VGEGVPPEEAEGEGGAEREAPPPGEPVAVSVLEALRAG